MKINLKAEKKTSFILLKVRLIFIKTTWHLSLRFRTVKPENGLYYLKQNDGGLGETYSSNNVWSFKTDLCLDGCNCNSQLFVTLDFLDG